MSIVLGYGVNPRLRIDHITLRWTCPPCQIHDQALTLVRASRSASSGGPKTKGAVQSHAGCAPHARTRQGDAADRNLSVSRLQGTVVTVVRVRNFPWNEVYSSVVGRPANSYSTETSRVPLARTNGVVLAHMSPVACCVALR